MSPRAEPTPRWLVPAVIVLMAIALRLPGLGDAVHDYDEQFYHLAGAEMLNGHMPYLDVWDRKPFGLFAIFAFAALVSGGSVLGYQLLAAAAAALGAWQTHALARRFGDGFSALVAAFLYLMAFPLFAAPSAQSEVFYLPLLLAMLQFTLKAWEADSAKAASRPALLAMALGGLALQVKYTVLPQCLLFGCVLLWRYTQLGLGPGYLARKAGAFAALGLAPTALVAAGYALAGHFGTFAHANFTSIFARGRLLGPEAEAHLRWIANGGGWLVFAALIGMVIMAARGRKGRAAYWLVAGYGMASLLAIMMVGNIYTHYFVPAATALALLAVPAFSHSPLRRFFALACIVLAFGFAHLDGLARRGEINRAAFAELTAAVQPHVSGARCLYVFDGPPALYPATGACLATRYAFPDHLDSALEVEAIGASPAAEMQSLLARRPAVIVTSSLAELPAPNRTTAALLSEALARDYQRVANVALPPRELWVYARKPEISR